MGSHTFEAVARIYTHSPSPSPSLSSFSSSASSFTHLHTTIEAYMSPSPPSPPTSPDGVVRIYHETDDGSASHTPPSLNTLPLIDDYDSHTRTRGRERRERRGVRREWRETTAESSFSLDDVISDLDQEASLPVDSGILNDLGIPIDSGNSALLSEGFDPKGHSCIPLDSPHPGKKSSPRWSLSTTFSPLSSPSSPSPSSSCASHSHRSMEEY